MILSSLTATGTDLDVLLQRINSELPATFGVDSSEKFCSDLLVNCCEGNVIDFHTLAFVAVRESL